MSHPSPLNTHFGTLADGSDSFPLDNDTYLPLSDSYRYYSGIRSLIEFGKLSPPSSFSALPPANFCKASPKAISGRTSYLRVRLEFLPYPQIIPWFFNTNVVRSSIRFYSNFNLSMDRSPGFGSNTHYLLPY